MIQKPTAPASRRCGTSREYMNLRKKCFLIQASDIFFDHKHIADKIVYNTFQILASFIGCFTISAAQQIVHIIGKISTSGSSFYRVIVRIQFHNQFLLFYLALQKWPLHVARILRRHYKSAKKTKGETKDAGCETLSGSSTFSGRKSVVSQSNCVLLQHLI